MPVDKFPRLMRQSAQRNAHPHSTDGKREAGALIFSLRIQRGIVGEATRVGGRWTTEPKMVLPEIRSIRDVPRVSARGLVGRLPSVCSSDPEQRIDGEHSLTIGELTAAKQDAPTHTNACRRPARTHPP